METSTAIVGIIVALGGGGLIGYLLKRFVPTREDTAAAHEKEEAAEQKGFETALKKQDLIDVFDKKLSKAIDDKMGIQQALNDQKFEHQAQLSKSEAEKINLKATLEIKDGMIKDNAETLKNIYIDMGSLIERAKHAEERERRIEEKYEATDRKERKCQEDIAELRGRLASIEAQK
jgi:uncharacterized protein YpmS